ncbi:ketopantoate reductase family protein [Shewanella glacialipiscicola]|uniref:ketopantoate reductase family protein n=1 Tax=Shewanella glacialipiscicola TaxID=614069 RepID=UPI003D79EB3A
MTRAVDIAILGAGAIGQLICRQLTAAGEHVGFIARDRQDLLSLQDSQAQQYSQSQKLSFTPLIASDDSHSPQPIDYRVPIIAANALDHIRLVIVCVKAYQVIDALLPLLHQLPRQCHILLLHNGMGPHLALAPLIEKMESRGLSLGTTSQGVLRQARWQIKQTGKGLTQLGHFTGIELAEHYRSAILTAIPNSEWVDTIVPCLWQKLAVNAAINPLTALHQCPNGALAKTDFSAIIEGILDELVTVAAQDGVPLDKPLLHDRIYQVIQLTAANFSSMHQDVAHQRQTEIDQINGYICERAQAHGLTTPINAKLCQQIKQLTVAT